MGGTMKKSINSVEFVPLYEMSKEDWDILEYDFLRNKAKNRIAKLIVDGKLIGFYRVGVFMKARTKPFYYWPATEEMLNDIDDNNEDDWGFFGNQMDEDSQSTEVDIVEEVITEVQFLSALSVSRLIIAISAVARAAGGEFNSNIVTELRQLRVMMENNEKLEDWQIFLLAILVFLYLGVVAFNDFLSKLSEEEERRVFQAIDSIFENLDDDAEEG